MDFSKQHDPGSNGSADVDDITSQLDQMNVDRHPDTRMVTTNNEQPNQNHHIDALSLAREVMKNSNERYLYYDQDMYPDLYANMTDNYLSLEENLNQQQQQQEQDNTSNILIVTNVDSSVFGDATVQNNFQSLFLAYDRNCTFRYLKSFRRVRIDFSNTRAAELARSNLSQCKFGNTEFKCYQASIMRVNSGDQETNSSHLSIPKLTKQFLISPPASPPVGWEPVNESSPCIDVQLISAIANLVPGKVHEIHAGNESQPGIYVEVCEEPQFETSMRSCSRIPRTMSPACCQANQ